MSASYKDLLVWQKACDFVTEVYIVARSLPREEMYALGPQIRRAAVSIPSNIAEGQQRKNPKEFMQFLRIALGSAAELDTQIIITKNLYPNIHLHATLDSLAEIRRMLSGLIRKLETVNRKL